MSPKYRSYNINQIGTIPLLSALNEKQIEEMRIVGDIYPFKANDYVLENLIDSKNLTDDPIFRLIFPQKEMLTEESFEKLKWAKAQLNERGYSNVVNEIRAGLNPHPAGQSSFNIPFEEEGRLEGVQHKYKNTVLFFPSHGQTCHAHCTFCFRWPQFIADLDLKIQAKEIEPLIRYLKEREYITDVLITGGDPMVMNSRVLSAYIEPLLKIKTIKNIRIGTKALSFWPYKFTSDPDAAEILPVLRKISESGKHLAVMAHFNHPVELSTEVVAQAIFELRSVGAEIRTQAPLLNHINNKAEIWSALWEKQVQLGCVPYYMFLARDTGAQHYFSVSLKNALEIFRTAIRRISGIARTVRGPIMSVLNGKIELLDIKSDVYVMRYLQHRLSNLSYRLFNGINKTETEPIWFDDLTKLSDGDSEYFEGDPGNSDILEDLHRISMLEDIYLI